jgi:hypothetical protein
MKEIPPHRFKNKKAILAFSLVLSLWVVSAGYSQLPNVREAIEEKKKAMEGSASLGAMDAPQTEESLEKAKMYSQLLTFRYAPSERDPFISSTVISPFVTEEEQTEITVDADQVNQAKRMVEAVVKNRIFISGIAFGRTGANYVVVYGDGDPNSVTPQILRAGEYLLVELGPEEASMVDNAYQVALRAGAEMALKIADTHPRPAIMLRLLKLDGRTAEIESPIGGGTFTKEYEKQMIRGGGPQPIDIK